MLPWLKEGKFPLYLAPMAGFTDLAYRQLCKDEGADVLITEFAMSDSINRDIPEAWALTEFHESQRPMGIQIFGATPESMAKAAHRIEERCRPDFIDLNFGCPSEKVTCQMAGASLLKTPRELTRIAAEVVKEVKSIPVTAKIRTGWDEENIVADQLVPMLQDVGIQALTIHGRTKVQGYSGEPDWDLIKSIAASTSLPIIGNGNIRNSAQVHEIMTQSNVSGVMIGRAALGYPWLFREIKTHLETGHTPPPPTLQHRWKTILDYAHQLASRPENAHFKGKIMWMRSKIVKLTKDMHGSKNLRLELNQTETLDQLHEISKQHLERYSHADTVIQERFRRR